MTSFTAPTRLKAQMNGNVELSQTAVDPSQRAANLIKNGDVTQIARYLSEEPPPTTESIYQLLQSAAASQRDVLAKLDSSNGPEFSVVRNRWEAVFNEIFSHIVKCSQISPLGNVSLAQVSAPSLLLDSPTGNNDNRIHADKVFELALKAGQSTGPDGDTVATRLWEDQRFQGILLRKGALWQCSRYGRDLLQDTILQRMEEIGQDKYAELKAAVNRRYDNELTALGVAITNGHYICVQNLVDRLHTGKDPRTDFLHSEEACNTKVCVLHFLLESASQRIVQLSASHVHRTENMRYVGCFEASTP
jgi:hypothetical protein